MLVWLGHINHMIQSLPPCIFRTKFLQKLLTNYDSRVPPNFDSGEYCMGVATSNSDCVYRTILHNAHLGWVLPYLVMEGNFRGDDPRF